MSVRRDEPFEIQPRANGAMAGVLHIAAVGSLVLGLVGALLPAPVGPAAAWGAVGCVVVAPLARIGWLGVRWVLRRDHVYAAIAFGLLAIVLLSGGLAVLQRS